MLETAPSTPRLPKLTAAPSPMMGRDNSAKIGLFHLFSVADGKKENLFTTGCVRHFISNEWPRDFMTAMGSIAEFPLLATERP